MCGIAGVIGRWPALEPERFRSRALELMSCRGPDGRGAFLARDGRLQEWSLGTDARDAECLLVHTRLAVIDVTSAGAQPMVDAAARHAITYNGETYNYEELASELGLSGGRRRGHSDTEVVLAWISEGRSVASLTGMFAFAYVDLEGGRASLVRDAFGIKPLFIARSGSATAFASDIRLLLDLPGVSRRVDPIRSVEFLRYAGQSTAGRRTAFAGIESVEPGERIDVDLKTGRLSRGRWRRTEVRRRYTGDFAQATRDVRDAFIESVRFHLKSDVRVGCALSGGIDSSAILCVMRRILGSAGEIHAVSHVTDSAARSEERWIDIAGAAVGAQVHKVRPLAAEMVRDLDDLVALQGEPIGTTSHFAQYGVFRRAREKNLTVMLDGQGADEMFGGYTHYRALLIAEHLRSGRFGKVLRHLRSTHLGAATSASAVILQLVRNSVPTAWTDQANVRGGIAGLPAWVRIPDPAAYYAVQEERRARFGASLMDGLREARDTGLVALLRYEDRNSMRFSIESRVPFLEAGLVDLVDSMPSEFIFGPEGQSKYVFREAMRGIVPDQILKRRDKIGFENDEAEWLLAARPWADQVVSRAAERSSLVDATLLRHGWTEFQAGRRALAPRLWAALLFLRWHELIGAEG
jgi:asparagine synthase (glutamine-hydrolysing)